jgi:hypothetical protein
MIGSRRFFGPLRDKIEIDQDIVIGPGLVLRNSCFFGHEVKPFELSGH